MQAGGGQKETRQDKVNRKGKQILRSLDEDRLVGGSVDCCLAGCWCSQGQRISSGLFSLEFCGQIASDQTKFVLIDWMNRN